MKEIHIFFCFFWANASHDGRIPANNSLIPEQKSAPEASFPNTKPEKRTELISTATNKPLLIPTAKAFFALLYNLR
jgi:hypothetical protein